MKPSSPESEHGSYRSYVSGFVLALLLTSTSFYAASQKPFYGWAMVYLLLGLAVLQMLVQLLYFLNLDREESPRLKAWAFGFMLFVVGILVIGSLWIMHHLQYHSDIPSETEKNITIDEGFAPKP